MEEGGGAERVGGGGRGEREGGEENRRREARVSVGTETSRGYGVGTTIIVD